MSVALQVSDVRREIYYGSGGPAATDHGAPSDVVLGKLFHHTLGSLLSHESDANLGSVLSGEGGSIDDWTNDLVDHVYHRLVGPQLLQRHAAIDGSGSAVLSFWTAVREACHWLAEIFWDHRERARRADDASTFRAEAILAEWFSPEQPLRATLSDPTWSQDIVLTGIADTIIRVSEDRWCVLEYKLGRTSPEADLAQAALYHLMIRNGVSDASSPSSDQSLALIGFLPHKKERVFRGEQVHDAQSKLVALLAEMAGVVGVKDTKPGGKDTRKRPAKTTHGRRPEPIKPSKVSAAKYAELGKDLQRAFREYGSEIKIAGEPIVGPTFVRFVVEPGRGVNPKSIPSQTQSVQVRLQLPKPPIVSIGAAITIDVQRTDRQFISFDDVSLPESDDLHGCDEVLVGVGIDGELRTASLSDTASYHMLVAGTSGSGKSEWLRSAVAGLIATNGPQHVQFVVIDPKRNAFHDLRDSPYLCRPPVFPDEQDVVEVLDDLIEEMESRYAAFDGVDSLSELIEREGRSIPRIVCVCDEYADLIMASTKQRKAIEERITRLGSKARACGIHLIIATQQPSRNIIKGALATNLPARVGLMMTTSIESRMMLEQNGAEDLLGKGDLLYKDIGDPQRYQAVYLDDDLRKALFLAKDGLGVMKSDSMRTA